jgi:UDP-N-acetylmuramate dehydrogenase
MLEIKENVSLAPLTSFRIGGPAKKFVQVRSIEELKEAIELSKQAGIDFAILGGGSNMLVSDNGFSGLIIQMKINELEVEEEFLKVDAGVPLIKAINMAAQAGLSGVELLAGIPGTLGGAVRGNAGAYGRTISDVVEKVRVLNSESLEIEELSKEQCAFGYRESIFKANKNLVIVSALLKLITAEQEEVTNKTKETIAKRSANELAGEKSAGSYFTNPIVADEELRESFRKDKGVQPKDDKLPSGWVIEQLGLKGKKMGGAMISAQHANYIINTGEAKAEDVIMLASYVKQQVRDKMGVQLKEEVSYLGF